MIKLECGHPLIPLLLEAPHGLIHPHVTDTGRGCVVNYLPGTGGDLCEFAQSPEGVASVLRAVPQQAEAHGFLVVVVLMMVVAVPQLALDNPGRRYVAEAAYGDQSGGEEHPEAAHTAEHSGSLGQKARRQTQIDPEPGFFFFLLPAQERRHLELTPSSARLQLQPALHQRRNHPQRQPRLCVCLCVCLQNIRSGQNIHKNNVQNTSAGE